MNTMDDYIATFELDKQKILQDMRAIIREVASEAEEKISWQMPTFYLKGNLVHFAMHKNHLGFYPGDSGVAYYLTLSHDYPYSKGAIQFPLNKPLPKTLIQAIVLFRVKENIQVKSRGKQG